MDYIKAQELLDSFSQMTEVIKDFQDDPEALIAMKAGLVTGYYSLEEELSECESQEVIKLYHQLQSQINQAIIIIDSMIYEGQEE